MQNAECKMQNETMQIPIAATYRFEGMELIGKDVVCATVSTDVIADFFKSAFMRREKGNE